MSFGPHPVLPMKLQQLELLVAVVQHGSIRAAARQLHLSQAAVTKSMRMLEEEAGVALLERRSRGIDLTDAGRRLVARARIITRQVALARDDLRQTAGGDAGNLRVGITPFLTRAVLGEAFAWFRQRYRNVQLELVDGLVHRVLPRIRDGSLDMALTIGDTEARLGEEFAVEHIQRLEQCVAVRRGHPVLEAPSAAALVQCEWVATQPMGGSGPSQLSAMFAAAGVAPPERVVVCEALQAMVLLRSSDSVATMLRGSLALPEMQDMVAIDQTTLRPPDVALIRVTRSDVPMTRAAEYFAHCLEQTIRGARLL